MRKTTTRGQRSFLPLALLVLTTMAMLRNSTMQLFHQAHDAIPFSTTNNNNDMAIVASINSNTSLLPEASNGPTVKTGDSTITLNATEETQLPPPPLPPTWNPNDLTHAGATFANNGSLGYVADVTAVRKLVLQQYRRDSGNATATHIAFSHLPLTSSEQDYVCHNPPGNGTERVEGYKLLTETVQVNAEYGRHYQVDDGDDYSTPKQQQHKLLCAIYTTDSNREQIQAVTETWAWRCDGFFAASTKTDETLGSVNVMHMGDESYQNMWQKTRAILAYMYDHYYHDFDFFYLCGDDTHVIVENLRAVLHNMMPNAITDPLFLGAWFRSPMIFPKRHDYYIIHGGSGYVLNRIALKLLVVDLQDCFADKRSSSEDRWVTQCLNRVGVPGNSSVDIDGKQRFHPEDPYFVATFDGLHNNSTIPYNSNGASSAVEMYTPSYELWARKNFGVWRSRANLTSPESVAFHRLKSPAIMKRHHAMLYEGSCPVDSAIGKRMT